MAVAGGAPTTLASFSGADGSNPVGKLSLVGDILYGTTPLGGANGDGNVFSVPVTGGAPTVLGSFDGTNGTSPYGGLTLSADGATFYGTTSGGFPTRAATLFSIPVAGGTPTALATFTGPNGLQPTGSLTLVGDTLYGTTVYGGAGDYGTVFSLNTKTGVLTTLVSFDGANGYSPIADLTYSDGTLYGTTSGGGAGYFGTVFALTLPASSNSSIAAAPEPPEFAALGIGLLGLAGLALRARKRRAA